MTDALKPCAHCGGEAEIYNPFHLMGNPCAAATYRGGVRCKECGNTAKATTPSDKAIAAWNRREPAGSAEPTDYAALEREHLGDPDKRTGIYSAGSAGKEREARLVAAPADAYSPKDMAFYRFWYGHMKNDLMAGALANVDHATARYIWDAALATAPAPMTDERRKEIEDAIKTTEYKYFGDYEFSERQHDAVNTLVEVARAVLAAQGKQEGEKG